MADKNIKVIRGNCVKEVPESKLKNKTDKDGNIISYGFLDAGWVLAEPVKEKPAGAE